MRRHDKFESFQELARHKKAGVDYRTETRVGPDSSIAIVAPHGGSIEWHTDDIARAIAGDDFSLYVFEGLINKNAFEELHVTSTRFDDPDCLGMIGQSEKTVTIHGCMEDVPLIYLGGKDLETISRLKQAFTAAGIDARDDGHVYTGSSPDNICNRNKNGAGVQIEFSKGIRSCKKKRTKCAAVIRGCLLG